MLNLLPTYTSKGGATVIGRKPMFEDSDEENLGRDIKAVIFETFGCYPILEVHENWTIEPEDDDCEPVTLRDYHAFFDTEKVDEVAYGLSYVHFLFEDVIKAKMAKPQESSMNAYASKKYCFSDSEEWWEAMEVNESEIAEGREKFKMVVRLG